MNVNISFARRYSFIVVSYPSPIGRPSGLSSGAIAGIAVSPAEFTEQERI
jgi:hypothetical protein